MIWNVRIKEKREENNLTLKQVAAFLGITEATAQRYECGAIKSVPYDILVKYAALFHCTPAYLMGWDSSDDLCLSDSERALIVAYRRAPESRRESVRALLEIKEKSAESSVS